MDIELTLNNVSNSSDVTTESTINQNTFKWTSAEIARWIQITVRPILIVLGTTGNILSFYIMRKTSLKNVSSCFYMSILAVADTSVLWSGCFGAWVEYVTRGRVDIRLWTDCKFYWFMFYFGKHYSSMLLVMMSMEKCFAVYFPMKSKTVCTVKTAKWATSVVGVILAGYILVNFFLRKSHFHKPSGRRICGIVGNYKVILRAIDSVLYSFGPFVLMFITNVAVVLKFMTAKCTYNNSTASTAQALAKSATRGTAMVVTVSVMFLLLTAPVGVENALTGIILLENKPLFELFSNITQYLNHTINGVLYCIVGTRFRHEFFKLICKKQKPENSSTTFRINATTHNNNEDDTEHVQVGD